MSYLSSQFNLSPHKKVAQTDANCVIGVWLRCGAQKSEERISHTSFPFRDGCLTDRADVGVSYDVITLTSLSDIIAQPQQVTLMPGIRFGNVLLTKRLTLKRISQPYIFSYLDLKKIVLQNASDVGQYKHSFTRTCIHQSQTKETKKKKRIDIYSPLYFKAVTLPSTN